MTILIRNPFKKTPWARIVGWLIVGAFISIALFADFLSPYDYRQQSRSEPSAPPSGIHFRDAKGTFHFRPMVFSKTLTDPLRLSYVEDPEHASPLELFVRGYAYRMLGLIETDLHLFGVDAPQNGPSVNLLGTDNLGRDRLSRLMHATRFSLIVCSLGVVLACLIGIVIGIVSGYSRGLADTILMGATDAMLSLPTLILILAARAAFPLELQPARAAFLLLLIFALTGWAEMARLARGLVLETRRREFVTAAVATGVTQARILFRHILPNISRPLVTQALLMLPAFLLAEIALSYLGVGVQEPEASLGNMLTAAGDLNQLRAHPVSILSPAIAIFIFVLGIRLLGDRKKVVGSQGTPSI